jgi:acetolactate synthase-1/2/3 large subunit
VLAGAGEDGTAALEMLAEGCGAPRARPASAAPALPKLPRGQRLTPETLGAALAALIPEGSILSDESISSGEAVGRHLNAAAPHDHLPVTGGSIGQGLPVALGAALACPGRQVVALEADGSGMYTLQSLWTMAREGLDVVTVVLANRRYRILDVEMRRTGAGSVGPVADTMIDIGRPVIDWVQLARGMGVPGSRAASVDEFMRQFEAAVREKGPALIEAVLEPE